MNELTPAQIAYITTVTNARGAAFATPYTFSATSAHANHFQIYVTRDSDGAGFYSSVPVHLPLPDPPSPVLDDAIDKALTDIERRIGQAT